MYSSVFQLFPSQEFSLEFTVYFLVMINPSTGHSERHEYSFLGPKVNMAARIMMAGYQGMVNCDALTMKCSDLSRDYFIPQPYKALKGIQEQV